MGETREHILETAARLFERRGYELVGINEIIAKSGVAKATFYAHFKSKERLCLEWLRAEARDAEASAGELLCREAPVREKVGLRFDALRRHVVASKYRGCPFSITASMLEPTSEVRQLIRDFKANSRAFWQGLAQQLRRDPASARALGDAWFLLFSGAITEAQNARSVWPVDSAKETALALAHD